MSDACGLVCLLRPSCLLQPSPISGARVTHSSLPPELWLEIFRYATYVPRVHGLSPGVPFERQRPSNFAWGVNTPVSSLATKRSLVVVCRAWRMLATELLYEHVVISSRRRAFLLARTLYESHSAAKRSYAQSHAVGEVPRGHAEWIRHVELRDCSRTSKTASFWNAVAAILSLLPNLHVLSGIWEQPLSQGQLALLSRYIGNTIRSLYWEEGTILEGQTSLLNATFLPKFQSLRVLDIRKLKLEDQDSFPTSAASQICLSSVAEVLLPTCPTVLHFAGRLSLPRLRSVVLDAANVRRSATSSVISAIDMFLAAHGAKITTLELLPMTSLSYKPSPISITRLLQPDVCPALDTFVFDCREKIVSAAPSPYSSPVRKPAYAPSLLAAAVPPSLLRFLDGAAAPVLSDPHRTLRRIGIRGMGISRLYPSRPTHAQLHLHAFLAHRALFPALETVRTVGLLVDASTDPYARDIFIWWTEKYEERGLDLQDGEGVVWVYTDPAEGKEAAAEEQLDSFDPTILVHKSDRRELRAAKGSV